MPKTYQEVMAGLKKEEIPQEAPDELPEERGEFREPPQPGTYRFQLPAAIENCFDIIDVKQRDGDGKVVTDAAGNPITYQRVNLVLDGSNALVILQSPGNKVNGEPFNTRISNIERDRWAGKDLKVKVSDLTYLLRAMAPEARPRTNEEFIQLCLQVLPNRQFTADVEWGGYCDDKKDAYFEFPDETGGKVYQPFKDEGAAENRKGCGKRVYQSKWPHDANGYAARGKCECGASLFPRAQLVRFKA